MNVIIYLALLNNFVVTDGDKKLSRLHYTQASFNQQIPCSFRDF